MHGLDFYCSNFSRGLKVSPFLLCLKGIVIAKLHLSTVAQNLGVSWVLQNRFLAFRNVKLYFFACLHSHCICIYGLAILTHDLHQIF